MSTFHDIVQLWEDLYNEYGYGPYDDLDRWIRLYYDIKADQGHEYANSCMVAEANEFRDQRENYD